MVFLGEPDKALSNIAAFSRQATAQGIELILFPERVVHGHNTPNTPEIRTTCAQTPAQAADPLHHPGVGELLFYPSYRPSGQSRSRRQLAGRPHEPTLSSRRRDDHRTGCRNPCSYANRQDSGRDDRAGPTCGGYRQDEKPRKLPIENTAKATFYRPVIKF